MRCRDGFLFRQPTLNVTGGVVSIAGDAVRKAQLLSHAYIVRGESTVKSMPTLEPKPGG